MSACTKLLTAFLLVYPITCYAQSPNLMGGSARLGMASSQPSVTLPDWDNGTLAGLSGKTAARVLATPILGDVGLSVRGQQDITIYQNASPSVVMVVTNDGLGSGSYLGSNLILTNAHVVGTNSYAGIVFKPQQEGAKINPSSVVTAKVLRIDRTRDLAVLQVNSVPAYVHPLEFGNSSEIKIGADVYAIGHPTGQFWTFTRGLISQIRKGYDWKDESGIHRADVIQTQTPINPGNSGGPLIAESGKLLGVNSFKAAQTEGVNFAVSVGDVIEFLKPSNRQAETNNSSSCKPVRLYDGRNKENNGRVVLIDTNCDHVADIALITPDDVSQPIQALIETKYDGKIDMIVDDFNRDGLWDISFYDTQHNGTIDLVGFHPDGKMKASRYEKYNPSETYTNYLAQNN